MRGREKHKAVRALARQGKDAVAAIAAGLELTPRQAEVVYHVALCGRTSRATAAILRIHVRTVDGHLETVRDNLKVSRLGLAKRVCAMFYGELDKAVFGANGRLRLKLLRDRLKLPERVVPVLRLIWEEKATKEIAAVLQLSGHTVRKYRRQIGRRLRARSPVMLVRRIYQEFRRQEFWQGSE